MAATQLAADCDAAVESLAATTSAEVVEALAGDAARGDDAWICGENASRRQIDLREHDDVMRCFGCAQIRCIGAVTSQQSTRSRACSRRSAVSDWAAAVMGESAGTSDSMPAVSTSSQRRPSSSIVVVEVVARRAAVVGDDARVRLACSAAPNRSASALNRLLLPTLGGPTRTTWQLVLTVSRDDICSATTAELVGGCLQSRRQFGRRDELDVFLDEIEARFELGEQREQFVAELVQRSGEIAGELLDGGMRARRRRWASITPSTASACVRSSRPARNARSVNSPGSARRAPARQTASQNGPQQRRRAERVKLGHRLRGCSCGRSARGRDRRASERGGPSSSARRATGRRRRQGECAASVDANIVLSRLSA